MNINVNSLFPLVKWHMNNDNYYVSSSKHRRWPSAYAAYVT